MPFERASDKAQVVLKGKTYNAMVSSIERFDRALLALTGRLAVKNPYGPVNILAMNDTGADIEAGYIVQLDDSPFGVNEGGYQMRFTVTASAPSSTGVVYGVAIGPAQNSNTVSFEVATAGVVRCDLDLKDPDHKYAKPIAGDVTKLESTYFEDEFKILWTASEEATTEWTTSEGEPFSWEAEGPAGFQSTASPAVGVRQAFVQFHGMPQTMSYAGKVTGDNLTPGGVRSIAIYDKGVDTGETVTAYLDWMHGGQLITLGKEVVVTYFRNEQRWRVTAAECE